MLYGIIAIIILLYFVNNMRLNNTSQNDYALRMLQERYAKGEITDEEYVTKRNILLDENKRRW